MDVSGTISPANVSEITGIIEDYNENMRYYNRNMRDLISIYRSSIPLPFPQINTDTAANTNTTTGTNILNSVNTISTVLDYLNEINDFDTIVPPVTTPVTTSTTPLSSVPRVTAVTNNRGNRYRYGFNNPTYPIIYNDPIGMNRTRFHLRNYDNLENVVVRPNNDQIRRATEFHVYCDASFSQIQCPISLEYFENGQQIRRIAHCGHIFNNDSLIEWFERNVRCPVCRHDIRDTSVTSSMRSGINDNSGNRVIPSNVVNYSSESEESESDDSESQTQTRENTTSPERTTNREILTNYVRSILNTITNHNTVPQISNSVNSILSTYNIPVIIDISYTTLYEE